MSGERYFAIVIRVPATEAMRELGSVVHASTVLGNMFREHPPACLPQGTRITRSIEITKEQAERSW